MNNLSLELLKDSYSSFILGEFLPLEGKNIPDKNPVTGETISRIYQADETIVNRAVDSARGAFNGWAKISGRSRSDLMLALANRIEENLELFATVETMDTGRVIAETREDVISSIDQFRYYASALRTHEDKTVWHDEQSYSMIIREPIGVVASIVPWNFPFLISCWKLCPALAMGNTVVMKPASATPLSLLLLAQLTTDLLPPGVLNVIVGPGSSAGQSLISHPGIDKIAFTGSTDIGKSIAVAAAGNCIPATLELGGKSANIIFPDAPMEKALDTALLGILYAQGQMCNAGSRLLVHEDIYSETVVELKKRFEKVNIGDPLNESVRMGPVIDENQAASVLEYVRIGIEEGARLVTGGKRLSGSEYDKGAYIAPTLFADVNNSMRVAREEIFGPVLVVISFEDEEEAIALANDSEFGLAGAVWTRNLNRAMRVARAVRTGTMWVNEYNLVPSHSPFGGYKKSGYGRDVHMMAMDSYSQTKNIFVSLSEECPRWYD